MPSPVGHLLAGAAVYLVATRKREHSRVRLTVTLLGSVLPDFDFVPGFLIGEPAAFHHGISHSFVFAALFGVLVFMSLRSVRTKKIAIRTGLLASLAYAVHVILDLVNVHEGTRGVPVLWPLFDRRFGFNLGLFRHFHHEEFARGIWSVARWDNLAAVMRELAAIGIPTLVLFLWKWKPTRSLNTS